jgi:hypothetical protein
MFIILLKFKINIVDRYWTPISSRNISMLSSHLCLDQPNGVVTSGFPIIILHRYIISAFHATFFAYFNLMTLTIHIQSRSLHYSLISVHSSNFFLVNSLKILACWSRTIISNKSRARCLIWRRINHSNVLNVGRRNVMSRVTCYRQVLMCHTVGFALRRWCHTCRHPRPSLRNRMCPSSRVVTWMGCV